MRIATAEERERVARFGLRPMPSEAALTILGNLLGHDELAQIVVADVDWERLRPAYEVRRAQPLISNMSPVALPQKPLVKTESGKQDKCDEREQAALLRELGEARPEDRQDVVLNQVRLAVARTLNFDAKRPIDIRQGLFEMGMDSLMSVELKGRLEASVGRTLPSTLTFNYPSIEALADYLSRDVLGLTQAHQGNDTQDETEGATTETRSAQGEDDWSEDELAELLAAKLARLQE
jgi:acyl carrier protein